MEWSEIAGSPTAIGLGTGWVAFFALAYAVFRAIGKSKWVPDVAYRRVVDAFDKSTTANTELIQALSTEQETHSEVLRQLAEEQKTGAIVRKFFTDLGVAVSPE